MKPSDLTCKEASRRESPWTYEEIDKNLFATMEEDTMDIIEELDPYLDTSAVVVVGESNEVVGERQQMVEDASLEKELHHTLDAIIDELDGENSE